MVCTFFGHRICPRETEPALRSAIIDLIENKGVNKFYVGNQGNFDFLVHKTLKELAQIYPIEYAVVLAYVPGKKCDREDKRPNDTIIPDGIESVPSKCAISWRNKWMLKRTDYVVTYVKHFFGGAAQFKELAERQNKNVINLV